jgi:hypothetical protein
MGVGGQRHATAALHREGPGSRCIGGWAGVENPAPSGLQSTDRSARNESVYRLSYPDPQDLSVVNATHF